MLKLTPRLRILDLDGSITEGQADLVRTLGPARVFTTSARDLGPRIRYLATRGSMQALESLLPEEQRDCLTLFGSGDFHHVTASLLRQFPASPPLTVVVFDRHPDWDRRSPWPCCGSWVLEALKMPHVRQVVMIGLGSEDIAGWRVNVGRVSALRSGKVAFYPFDCPVSYSFAGRPVPAAFPMADFVGDAGFPGRVKIIWKTLAPDSTPDAWERRMAQIIAAIPTQNVYLSVDKDCLTPDAALTNWEPGHLPLGHVLAAIRLLIRERDIVGADITGEFSPAAIVSPYFRYLYAQDRPDSAPGHRNSAVPEPSKGQLQVNATTNHALLSVLGF